MTKIHKNHYALQDFAVTNSKIDVMSNLNMYHNCKNRVGQKISDLSKLIKSLLIKCFVRCNVQVAINSSKKIRHKRKMIQAKKKKKKPVIL